MSPSESIEHILPKSKASEKFKHRLGNLVLLPPRLNSKLQADSPKNKAVSYRQTGLLIASEVADLIDKAAWNNAAIHDREETLLAWAKTEWSD
ncbi:MAG: HNH endonuclease family protein [Gammaproteobacteria bacterium]|nr:HNH endonuclease family protein [Gammaproteobacteria bacterium]